jgi:hypothetical protein
MHTYIYAIGYTKFNKRIYIFNYIHIHTDRDIYKH